MIKSKLITATMASSLLLASGGAMAASITNADGTFNNWAGFDWASNGTTIVDGFDATALSDTFDLTYYSKASNTLNPAGAIIPMLGLFLNNYEYTIEAKLNESSTCNTFAFGICTNASFTVNSGTFKIWYDTSSDANMVTGAGITDGVGIIDGTILAQPGGGFDIISGGNATLQAVINYTNNAFINPDLITSTATTTLQIGTNITGWAAPTSMPDVSGGTQALPGGYIALQSDGNQNFQARVPEPASIALLGLGLVGIGAANRRRNKRV